MKNFRTLKAEEIEVRPQSVKNGKANMLLYIDSRCVTNILDETVGCMNWQSEFYEVNGQIMGKLGIWDDVKEMWIWKSDTGTESNIEAEKGLISDIYKRLLSRWGVCELYSSPKITIDDDGYGNTGYKVSEIEYDENRKITHLVIVNRFGKQAYSWNKMEKMVMTQQQPIPQHFTSNIQTTDKRLEWEDDIPSKDNMSVLTEYCTQQKNSGADKNQLKRFFDFYSTKANGWKGKFDVDGLWQRWNNKSIAA